MPEPNRPLKVFLSYASQDKPLVKELSRRLEDEGWVDVWIDAKNLLPGHDWRLKIEEAVEESDTVIICLSTNSITKEGYVQKELRYAREIALEKPEDSIFLIPLRLDECDVPRGLRFYQWADYFGEKKDESYDALTASLKLRYEQKMKFEEAERLRKEQLQREATEKKAREKAEKEATEKARQKAQEEENRRIAKEKAERQAAEREKKEKERLEKMSREGDRKSKQENEKKEIKSVSPKPKLDRPKAYLFGSFTVIAFGMVLFSFLKKDPVKVVEPTSEINPTRVAVTLTYTETIEPTNTLSSEPSSTSTATSTLPPTPLPSKFIDSKGVPMALVSAGEFIMGSEAGDDAKSVHTVYLDSYYMDIYEVTNAFYKDCVTIGVCSDPESGFYPYKDYSEHPVVNITWGQADQYCAWRGGSLPTEAQWEKAARGADERTYPWGEGIDCSKANYRTCNSNTVKIGSYESGKSPYGIYDMAGNVWEWTADWYDDNYYQYSISSNPLGPVSGRYRVMRGGSWSFRIEDLPTYNRRQGDPDSGRNTIGFRCVMDVP